MPESSFGHKLVLWYEEQHRPLPWRQTNDPYRIWLSEIILQQTRVAQGLSYYLKFTEKYPDVFALANASEQEVLRLWQGLGYYSRARNLLKTARIIVEKWNGQFPQSYAELIKLSGIGDYTASAIASFAFNEKTAVVDGNVFRVLSRYLGIGEDISRPASRKIFKEAAFSLMLPGQEAVFNQAIMEFGALQCVPGLPECEICPVKTSCYAYHRHAQTVFPVKNAKVKIVQRNLHYLVLHNNGNVVMKERGPGDIWQGLYDFYLADVSQEADGSLSLPVEFKDLTPVLFSGPKTHLLTHQKLAIHFWLCETHSLIRLPMGYYWYSAEESQRLPKPLPIHDFLKIFL